MHLHTFKLCMCLHVIFLCLCWFLWLLNFKIFYVLKSKSSYCFVSLDTSCKQRVLHMALDTKGISAWFAEINNAWFQTLLNTQDMPQNSCYNTSSECVTHFMPERKSFSMTTVYQLKLIRASYLHSLLNFINTVFMSFSGRAINVFQICVKNLLLTHPWCFMK